MPEFHRLGRVLAVDVPQVVVYPNDDGLDGMVCDSPIEGAFAELMFKTLHLHGCVIQPQYRLGPYRYDFAVSFKGHDKPAILVECDGKAYHSTPEQRANDARKNAFAFKNGIRLLRFRGTDIYRKPSLCIDDFLLTLESIGFGR